MMQLGGNIELEGFEATEPGKLVVVKKIVGSYARQISDSKGGLEKLNISMARKDDAVELKATAVIGGSEISKQTAEKNLFYALDKVFKELIEAIG